MSNRALSPAEDVSPAAPVDSKMHAMAQFKIYGQREFLTSARSDLSNALHASAVEAFALPADKRFHRFICLDPEDFIYPAGRSSHYTIVEALMFEGRTVESKKAFYKSLYDKWKSELGESSNDLEIILIESARHNWGIRGVAGDELELSYRVEV